MVGHIPLKDSIGVRIPAPQLCAGKILDLNPYLPAFKFKIL